MFLPAVFSPAVFADESASATIFLSVYLEPEYTGAEDPELADTRSLMTGYTDIASVYTRTGTTPNRQGRAHSCTQNDKDQNNRCDSGSTEYFVNQTGNRLEITYTPI